MDEGEIIPDSTTEYSDADLKEKIPGMVSSKSKSDEIDPEEKVNNIESPKNKSNETDPDETVENIDSSKSKSDETDHDETTENIIDSPKSKSDETEPEEIVDNIDSPKSKCDETDPEETVDIIDSPKSKSDETEPEETVDNIESPKSKSDETDPEETVENIDSSKSKSDETDHDETTENIIDSPKSKSDETHPEETVDNIESPKSKSDETHPEETVENIESPKSKSDEMHPEETVANIESPKSKSDEMHPEETVANIESPKSKSDEGSQDSFSLHQCRQETLQQSLFSLGLKQDQVQLILDQGEKFVEKIALFAKKLKISKELTAKALDILKSFKEEIDLELTQEDIKTIEECLLEYPDEHSYEDIALLCDIDERLVSKYFEKLPLKENQKMLIDEKYKLGYSVNDIVTILKIPSKMVQEYVEKTYISFSGNEGGKVLAIIYKYFGKIPVSTLMEKIRSKNLKLQDQLCYILPRKNKIEFNILEEYFLKFKESKDFLNIDLSLTMEDILKIKQSSKDSLEQLSTKLNKVESIISDYIHRYPVYPDEKKHCTKQQYKRICIICKDFGTNVFSFDKYRTIITRSFDDIISIVEDESNSKKSKDRIIDLLPLVFYYLKCSLPFEDIARIIANVSDITLTTHDVFHLIFQLSDPVLKGLCIEHYSFSNAVPLYYPKLLNKSTNVEFAICKELWYCMEQYNGLISFGLGRASWNPVGKSSLLDLIFETDFVKGSPQNSAFHFRSIDIQLTKNLFGEATNSTESTKWAYIDCHSHSVLDIIQVMASRLDVALIHVCYNDFVNNKEELNKELIIFEKTIKHVYLFIRDSECLEVSVSHEKSSDNLQTLVFIPDLTRTDIKSHSVIKSLKKIGYEIFHLEIENRKYIQSNCIHDIANKLDYRILGEILADRELIQKIIQQIDNKRLLSSKIDFSFLNYYPNFVAYMSSYHKASYETDQDIIDKLNANCNELYEILNNTSKGDIVNYFNAVLKRDNSTLILWKLSRELSQISKSIDMQKEHEPDTVKEQKNDKYTLEILWREALLSHKYGQNTDNKSKDSYRKLFASNLSKQVESGEAFELIDGDNLRFFNKDIDSLLNEFYKKQNDLLGKINKKKSVKLKPAPIVVSIFGPQSSGKSTLLNYCFGCKFLTSAGRCTRGIYGSLSKLDRPVNLSQSFLILDTEGLDAIERDNIKDTSMIHFDRTMVLFCLSVSQVVIINVKGDIGSEMQNLLQICAYSLNRLKVSRVKAPKIFFVLNQQADPDPNKHLDSINLLMEKLNSESGLMESEGVKISDLIQVSKENLFILPSAFNSQQMNKPGAKLFETNVIKLSPTIAFADKCASLRLAIINQLDHMPQDDRAPFQTMSEWMEMAGVIWDTIIKYQDIVKYKNLEELMCSNKLGEIQIKLMKEHIYNNEKEFIELVCNICKDIDEIESYLDPNTILTKYMVKFDEVFVRYQDACLREFSTICKEDTLLKKMPHIFNETASNIRRLIYVTRKQHEDQIKLEIRSVLTEINISESMKHFQEAIIKNVDKYLNYNIDEQKLAFEDIWNKTFGVEDLEEEIRECQESFTDLYSIFLIEYDMEKKQSIYSLFLNHNFKMNSIIESFRNELILRFQIPLKFSQSERLVYPLNEYHCPLKEMVPYNGRPKYDYLCQDSLYKMEKTWYTVYYNTKMNISKWIPKECHSLIKYCSGLENHADIIWKTSYTSQAYLLTSKLRNPDNLNSSTWEKFINDISTDVIDLLETNSNVSHAVVKQIIHILCFRIRLLNYEIGFILAGLSNTAVRMLSTLVFAYAFKFLWEEKLANIRENQSKKDTKKRDLLQYFFQKIENRKMARGKWNRDTMSKSDKNFSQKYALDFAESIKRGLKTVEQRNSKTYLEDRKYSFSHESIASLADEMVVKELSIDPGKEVIDVNNFVVQFICNRNKVFVGLFRDKWKEVEEKLYEKLSQNVRIAFIDKISILKSVVSKLFQDLNNLTKDIKHMGKAEEDLVNRFDSDNNFEVVEQKDLDVAQIKEIPFKAMNNYLKMYFDPTVKNEEFTKYFSDIFEIDGSKVRVCEINTLPLFKPTEPILDTDTFKKLVNTKMFNSTELIFNIHEYVKQFQITLENYQIELKKDEFLEMIELLKNEFETNMIGCPSQCPSCGKFCEREIHPGDGKCQIKTGHQISSMGGKVWNADTDKTAVLFMCDVYKDETNVILSSGRMKWGEFKEKCGGEWNWTLPVEDKYKSKQLSNQKTMKDIWNKFGRGILDYYYKKEGTQITFVPYTTYEEVNQSLFSAKYHICFVIDGTGSMRREIERARVSVGQLIKFFTERGCSSEFKVVIYRDHCDNKIIEVFPDGNNFTPQQNTIEDFLNGVEATGGGDFPEAVLDGLATAATKSNWKCTYGIRNKIIHIYDAPSHGDFPNYTSHSSRSDKKNCCCCNHGTLCAFDWDRDVWKVLKKFNIEYNGISTDDFDSGRHDIELMYSNYESKMKKELGDLCADFQVVGKEVLNDAIVQIFVDHK